MSCRSRSSSPFVAPQDEIGWSLLSRVLNGRARYSVIALRLRQRYGTPASHVHCVRRVGMTERSSAVEALLRNDGGKG